MSHLPEVIDDEALIRLIEARFPQIAAQLDDIDRRSCFMPLTMLAKATQVAISDEDVHAVQVYFSFVGDLYERSTAKVKNAVHVSYLECLGFNGRHGTRIQARDLLSPNLQSALVGLEVYNRTLVRSSKDSGSDQAKPRNQSKKRRDTYRRRRSKNN